MANIYVTDAGRLFGPFVNQPEAESWIDSHRTQDCVLGIVRITMFGNPNSFIATMDKAHEMGTFQVLVHQYRSKNYY